MSGATRFPAGEQELQEAHGLAVTGNGAGRYTVWRENQRGRWVEVKVWHGPQDGPDVIDAADRLLARALAERTGHPAVLPGVARGGAWGPAAAERLTEQMWEAEAAARDTTGPRQQRVYLACPMRGIPGFNFPAFFAAEHTLVGMGYEVFNPARYDVEQMGFQYEGLTGNEDLAGLGFDLRHTLGKDMEYITGSADVVAVMPGWQASKGATAEVATARAIGLPIIDAGSGEPIDLDTPPAVAAPGVTIVNVTNTPPAPSPEPDTACCGDGGYCDDDAKQAPWGVLPSEMQMAAQRDADYGHPGPNFTTTAAYWREHVKAKYGMDVPFDTDDVPAMNVLQKLSRQARKPKRDNWDDISGYADTAVMAGS